MVDFSVIIFCEAEEIANIVDTLFSLYFVDCSPYFLINLVKKK